MFDKSLRKIIVSYLKEYFHSLYNTYHHDYNKLVDEAYLMLKSTYYCRQRLSDNPKLNGANTWSSLRIHLAVFLLREEYVDSELDESTSEKLLSYHYDSFSVSVLTDLKPYILEHGYGKSRVQNQTESAENDNEFSKEFDTCIQDFKRTFRKRFLQFQSVIQDLTNKCNSYERQNNDLMTERKKLESAVHDLENQLAECKSEKEHEFNKLDGEIQSLRYELSLYDTQHTNEMKKWAAERTKLLEEKGDLATRVCELEKELSEMERAWDDEYNALMENLSITHAYSSSSDQIAKLQARVKELEKENGSLKNASTQSGNTAEVSLEDIERGVMAMGEDFESAAEYSTFILKVNDLLSETAWKERAVKVKRKAMTAFNRQKKASHKETIEAMNKTAEAMTDIASTPRVGTLIMEQNNGQKPELIDNNSNALEP